MSARVAAFVFLVLIGIGYIGYANYYPKVLAIRVGIYTASWNFSGYSTSAIINTFDMDESYATDYSDKMNAVHAANPDYKCLLYWDTEGFNFGVGSSEWNYAVSQGWLLKFSNGAFVSFPPYPNEYFADITNSSYQQWWASQVVSRLNQYPFFDGVFADNSLKYNQYEWQNGPNGTNAPINPATGTYFNDQLIWNGDAGMLNALINAVGPNKLVLANGIWTGSVWYSTDGNGYRNTLSQTPNLSGIMSEGLFNNHITGASLQTETEWTQSLDLTVWIQDNFLVDHPNRVFVGVDYSKIETLPAGISPKQEMMYGYSSMLLGVNYATPQNTICFMTDEYLNSSYPGTLNLAQTFHNLTLGEPTNAYYEIPSTHVYSRDFSLGKVLVNPSSSVYSVALDKSYKTLAGITVSGSLTVYPHTGEILTTNLLIHTTGSILLPRP